MLDSQLTPWLLEVNMSPAMAHRSTEQAALIAGMCAGLVQLAILPHVAGEAGEVLDDCYCVQDVSPSLGAADTESSNNSGASKGSNFGSWKPLSAPPPPSSVTQYQQSFASATSSSTSAKHSTLSTKTYRVIAPSDDWTDSSTSSKINSLSSGSSGARPKSANSAVRRKSLFTSNATAADANSNSNAINSANGGFVTSLESSFVFVCKAVALHEIRFADTCCDKFGKILLLQR